MARTCQCPKPPGGSITCSDKQLALCSYRDGQIVSGCFDQPDAIAEKATSRDRTLAMRNWALGIITNRTRSLDQRLGDSELDILRNGRYVDPDGNETRFTLPATVSENNEGGATASASG